MNDPLAGKYRRLYKREFGIAGDVLSKHGGELTWSTHDYQAFVYREPTVCLVFYPHRTSAWNHHIRVRDQGSKNKVRAQALMAELHAVTGDCTFSEKNQYPRRYERAAHRKDSQC